MIYILVIILLLALIYKFDIQGNRIKRDFWYKVVLIIFVLIAGLRYRLGIDTPIYLENYFHYTPKLQDLKIDSWSMSPFWQLLNSIGKTIGVKFFILQIVQAAIVNIVIFKYVKKHCPYIFTCVFFFFIWMYASYCMEAMKAGFSMAICLYANDYVKERKWSYASTLFIIAVLFHPSSLIIVIFSFISFLRFNAVGLMVLTIAFFVGNVLESYYGVTLSFLSFDDFVYNKAEIYGESDTYSFRSGKNIIYYLFNYVPLLLTLFASFYMVKKSRQNDNLMKLEPLLFMGALTYIISSNLVIFYRIFYFYVIYIILFITQATVDVIRRKNLYGKFPNYIAILLVIPFMFVIYISYKGDRWMKFIPYSSVIEKSVDRDRERMYDFNRSIRVVPVPREDEY